MTENPKTRTETKGDVTETNMKSQKPIDRRDFLYGRLLACLIGFATGAGTMAIFLLY